MDFQSAMETFAEAWVAANTKGAPPANTEASSTQVFHDSFSENFY